jgi:hypothetical protein
MKFWGGVGGGDDDDDNNNKLWNVCFSFGTDLRRQLESLSWTSTEVKILNGHRNQLSYFVSKFSHDSL